MNIQPAQLQALRILKSWHTVEFFQPYTLEHHASSPRPYKISHNELQSQGNQLLPWLSTNARQQLRLKENKRYHYVLYLGVFDKSELIDVTTHVFGQEQNPTLAMEFEQRHSLQGDTCFAKLYLNEWGQPDFIQMSMSTMPWATGQLLKGHHSELSLQAYDKSCQWLSEIIGRIGSNLPEHPYNNQTTTLDSNNIAQLLIELYQFAGFQPKSQFAYTLEWFEVKQPKPKNRISPTQDLPHPSAHNNNNEQASNENSDETRDETTEQAMSPLDKKVRVIPILNSFYLNDLEMVINTLQNASADSAIMQYLSIKQNKHPDLYTPKGLELITNALAPQHLPAGRWPAPSQHQMNLMQQFAINTVFNQLKDQGLLSVNGPPGTGKTTLLRDIIANNIVERGKILADLPQASDGIDDKGFLINELCGFEMVVASTNNLAVENISKELPRLSALGEEFAHLDHLRPVANQLNALKTRKGYQAMDEHEQCWGIICAVLGRANNRYRFIESMFFDKHFVEDSDNERHRPPQYNYLNLWRYRRLHKTTPFKDAKQHFNDLQAQFNQAQQQLTELDNLRKWLNHNPQTVQNRDEFNQKLQSYSHILQQFNHLTMPSSSDDITSAQTQLNSYYVNEQLNTLRSSLFIAALNLHMAWFDDAIKNQQVIDHFFQINQVVKGHEHAEPLKIWQLLFMLVPVVSTTFASMARMFEPIKAQQLGWLMIDEAGQAIPQAAVGGIWRAKRTIVVGDPQQIEPVFTTPTQLTTELCQQILGNDHASWNPQHWSVQQIVDRANPYGCQLNVMNKSQWIGIPLWVHRRCIEPMFSLANRIAYDNRMIHGLQPQLIAPQAHKKAGMSYWQISKGNTTDRQYQQNLALDTLKLLNLLARDSEQLENVYIITPFRAVKSNLSKAIDKQWQFLGLNEQQYKRWRKNNLGTVHTFQGKENTIVILVLGCDTTNAGGAKWAASKPNLLNVALTRAKKHIYVVGDPDVWQGQNYFSDLAQTLSIQY